RSLQLHVELFTLAKQIVQLDLAQHASQSGLRKLRRRIQIVGDFDHGLERVDDAEINHGIHFDRDVVARHHILSRDLQRLHTQRDADHAIDGTKNKNHAGPLGIAQNPAEPEYDATFVLGKNLDAGQQVDHNDDHNHDER